MIIDLEKWDAGGPPTRVARASLQARIAGNAAIIAASVEHFQRLSKRLEHFHHVLSLLDGDGVVLYSHGTTGMVREQGRVPGTDWSVDYFGPSAAARAIAAGVPVIIVGAVEREDQLLSVRMGCPIRLSNAYVAGVVVLSVDLTRTRAELLIDLCRMAKKICTVAEEESNRRPHPSSRSKVQPFEEAEIHLARVLALPQINPTTRAHLAAALAELEETRRKILLGSGGNKGKRGSHARAQGV